MNTGMIFDLLMRVCLSVWAKDMKSGKWTIFVHSSFGPTPKYN